MTQQQPSNHIPETKKMAPGDELHLNLLMAPHNLNLVTGLDRQHLLAFGRAAFEAGQAAAQQAVQPSPEATSIAPTLMTNDQAIAWAWADVRKDVGTENWTTGDSCNFYGFFLHGWNYRGQYELQRNATKAAVMREIADTCDYELQQAPAHPAEGVPAQEVLDGGTPGPWRVRKRTNDAGEVLDCFVTAPDCQGRAYDAHILGDDYDSIELKLADAELIVAAVNAYRASATTHPTQQGMDVQDAARWREVLQHVGAAPHFGGQHFTLNTLQAPDTSLGFKANLMSGSVAQHFTKAIDAALAAQAKQGEQA